MVRVSLIWMYDEGILGLFLFDLWDLFDVDFVIGGVMCRMGIVFFNCLGMDVVGWYLYMCSIFVLGWVVDVVGIMVFICLGIVCNLVLP